MMFLESLIFSPRGPVQRSNIYRSRMAPEQRSARARLSSHSIWHTTTLRFGSGGPADDERKKLALVKHSPKSGCATSFRCRMTFGSGRPPLSLILSSTFHPTFRIPGREGGSARNLRGRSPLPPRYGPNSRSCWRRHEPKRLRLLSQPCTQYPHPVPKKMKNEIRITGCVSPEAFRLCATGWRVCSHQLRWRN